MARSARYVVLGVLLVGAGSASATKAGVPAAAPASPSGSASAEPAAGALAGRSVADALRTLQSRGLTIFFTSEVVRPGMMVSKEPAATDLREILDEILSPHGLRALEGFGGVLIVVPVGDAAGAPSSLEGEVLALGGRRLAVPGPRVRALAGDRARDVRVEEDGRFSIAALAPGLYTLEAGADGYLTQRIDVAAEAGKTRRVVFHLHPQPFVEEEIVVRPSRLTLLQERPDSAFSLTRDDLDHLPHLGGDLFRATSLLPGATANDFTAQFSIHGGRRDEVKVLLDGQELYEAFHLKDYDNALSIVPARALSGASLSTGAYAVSYGDRMSGVLDLRTAETGPGRHYLLSASVLDLVASSSGAFGGEREGGWLVTGRRGSIDFASEFFGNEDPGFWDLLGKAEIALGPGRLAGRMLFAADELELDKIEEDSSERLENDYESRYGWITYQAAASDRLLVESAASWADIRRDRLAAISEEKGIFDVGDRRDLEALGLTQSWSLAGGGRHLPSWGWELRRYDAAFDYSKRSEPEFVILAPFSPPRPTDHAFDGVVRGDHAGIWASDRAQVLGRMTAELGLRWDEHEATSDTLWSPRANLAWRLDERSVVRASWGRFFQSQRPYELQVEDAESALFPAELSEHSLLGYETILARRGVGLQGVRVELFRREVDHPRPRYENLLEPLNFVPEIEPDRVRITPHASEAEGVELLLRARGGARLDGWLAYSYSRARDRIDRDTVPRSLDQPHALTLGIDFRPSPRTSVSAAWRYRSGWPTTPVGAIDVVDPEEPEEGPEPQLVFGRLNSLRLGTYHRLDLRASRRVDLRRGALTMFLEVQNLYDRANDGGFDVTLDDETGAVVREPEAWPGIFPSLGVAWEF
jgi:outer membrane receptor protein involved in Fe transport